MSTHPTQETPQEDTRQRIIAGAMQLFGRVGYSQATTRALAEAAGVNEVTLFRHFGSKKNLLIACMQARNAAGFAETFETGLTGNYAGDILHMARLQIRDTTAGMEILRILICDARNVPELREAMLSGGRGNLGRISAYFQRQIDAGVVRPDFTADQLSMAFDALFSSSLIFENLFEESLAPDLTIEKMIHPLVDLFVRGTRA